LGFLFVVENDNNQNKEPWWKPAAEIFGEVSTWVVVPIVGALIAGKALDTHFGTKPWIFIGLTGVAFLVSSFGIVRTTQKYMQKIEKEEKQKKDKEE